MMLFAADRKSSTVNSELAGTQYTSSTHGRNPIGATGCAAAAAPAHAYDFDARAAIIQSLPMD